MSRLISAVIVSGGIALTLGCSGDVTKSDPKLSGGGNPKLKPAEAGGGGTPSQPKGNSTLPGD